MDQRRMRSRTSSVTVLRAISAVENHYIPRHLDPVTCPPWARRHLRARRDPWWWSTGCNRIKSTRTNCSTCSACMEMSRRYVRRWFSITVHCGWIKTAGWNLLGVVFDREFAKRSSVFPCWISCLGEKKGMYTWINVDYNILIRYGGCKESGMKVWWWGRRKDKLMVMWLFWRLEFGNREIWIN